MGWPVPAETSELPAFAVRLREAREMAGLTQRELSRRMRMDEGGASPRISQYETGVHHPQAETARRLAEELGVPLAYLYADSDKLARAILAFSRLSEEEQDYALRLLGSNEPPKANAT
jgi:transcriptional regulator with XRE-family HTH domain